MICVEQHSTKTCIIVCTSTSVVWLALPAAIALNYQLCAKWKLTTWSTHDMYTKHIKLT